MDFKVTVLCCLCSENYSDKIVLPDGWKSNYDGTDVETGF